MLIITRHIKYMSKGDKKWFEKRILSCAEITFHLSIISHCELQFSLTKIRNLSANIMCQTTNRALFPCQIRQFTVAYVLEPQSQHLNKRLAPSAKRHLLKLRTFVTAKCMRTARRDIARQADLMCGQRAQSTKPSRSFFDPQRTAQVMSHAFKAEESNGR